MPTVNTKFVLSGEKEYRESLSNINAKMKELNSEMKLVDSEYKNAEKSEDALRKKNEILTKTVEEQEKKVATLRTAMERAAEQYGENDTKTLKWKTSLNNAQTELNRLNGELTENQKELQAASGELDELGDKSQGTAGNTKGLGDAIGDVAGKLGIQLPDGIRNTLNGLGSLNPGLLAAAGAIAAVGAAVVGAEKKLMSVTKDSAAFADEIITLSKQTGLSTKTLQEFTYAAELLDVPVETIQGSLTKLTRNMDSARDGNEKLQTAFNDLGVEITNSDGTLRDAEDVFYDAIAALGKMKNETDRDATAMEIFGKSAQDLNPLIEAGTGAMKDYAEEADEVGAVLDDMSLNKLGAVDDAYQRFQQQLDTTKNKMAVEFAPYMEDALTNMTELTEKLGGSLIDSGIVDAMGMLLETTVGLLDPIKDVNSTYLPQTKDQVSELAILLADIADFLNVISGILTGDNMKIMSGLGGDNYNKLIERATERANKRQYGDASEAEIISRDFLLYGATAQGNAERAKKRSSAQATSQFLKIAPELVAWSIFGMPKNAAGTPNWKGGLTWISENGPELAYLPAGSAIMTAQESRKIAGDQIFVNVDANHISELQEIVKFFKRQRRTERMGGQA